MDTTDQFTATTDVLFEYMLDPGIYEVTEDSVPAGWTLTDISCNDDSITNLGTATASMDVQLAETVECTFTNTGDPSSDGDSDGVPDINDNCPDDPNPLQEDFDGDGLGYFCDLTCATDMDFVHTFNDGDMFDLLASDSITYEGMVASGSEIVFDAGQGVTLKNGTSIEQGALFTIYTIGCVP